MDTRPTPPAVLDGLDPALRDKYVAGLCTSEEQRHIEVWMSGNPARKAALTGLRLGLVNPAYPPILSASEMRARIRAVVDLIPARAGAQAKRNGAFFPRNSYWQRFAASAAALCVAALVVLAVGKGISVFRQPASSEQFAGGSVYTTRVGERARVTLPDGSVITLAPHTTVRTARQFGDATRAIEVSGEVFIHANSAAKTPFVVHTGSVVTRVLGTQFGMRYYAGDSSVQVAVLSGRVSSGGPKHALVVSAGQVAYVTDSGATSSVASDVRVYTDWTRGHLVFDNARVSTVLTTLTRWYDYQFVLADTSMASRHISVAVDVSDAADMFAALKSVLGVEMSINERVVTLTPQLSHPRIKRGIKTPGFRALGKPSTEMGR